MVGRGCPEIRYFRENISFGYNNYFGVKKKEGYVSIC
jgi:hypothetical protein